MSLLTQRLAAPSREGRGTNRHALGCIISPRPKSGRGWYIAASATSIPLSERHWGQALPRHPALDQRGLSKFEFFERPSGPLACEGA